MAGVDVRTLVFQMEYDGSVFSGYQRQRDPALETVQGLLENILSQVLDQPVEAVGAGRTDTGVHAVGQMVHVRTTNPRPLATVTRALWRLGHGRISVPQAWEAPDWFHARHSAARRIYQYHVLAAPQPSPLLGARTWHVWRPLDVRLMAQEARTVRGRRDFKAFQAGGEMETFFRTVHRFEVTPLETQPNEGTSHLRRGTSMAPLLCVEIEADAFLPHMVRMLMGTLVDVGSEMCIRDSPGTLPGERGLPSARSARPAPCPTFRIIWGTPGMLGQPHPLHRSPRITPGDA